jgi:hypothetical protein
VGCFNTKKFYSYSLSEYSFQMFLLVSLLYILNYSVKELEGKVVCIDTYHDTMQKYWYIMIRFFVYRYSTLDDDKISKIQIYLSFW